MNPQSQLKNLYNSALLLEQLNAKKQWHSKQQEVLKAIFEHGYKRIFIRKGRKGGGTHTILYPVTRLAGLFKNRACFIIGPQDSLEREIVWKNKRLYEFIPKEWNVKFGEYEARAKFPNGSFIKVTGANDHKNMVGIEGDVFVFDELADHDPRAYENCYPNLASRDAIWIVVGAPPIQRVKSSFYYKLEQEIKKDKDWFFIHWSIWDNAEFLPGGREWIENEKKKYYARGQWDLWEQLYEARYVIGGSGTVLSNFRPDGRDSHVVPADWIEARISCDKKKLQWWAVFDPGFATCFCVLLACYNPYTSEVFIVDEIYETDRNKCSVEFLWPQFRAKQDEQFYGGYWRRVYDSAAPGFPNEVRARWGKDIGFIPSYKQEGDEDKYFRIINSGLYLNKVWISERCGNGIMEMQDYATDPNGVYPNQGNHFLDCLRYLFKAANISFVEKQDDIMVKYDRLRESIIKEMGEESDKKDVVSIIERSFDFDNSDPYSLL